MESSSKLATEQLEHAVRNGNPLKGADLRKAQLKEAHLSGAHLEEAHLSGAQLKRASLVGAQLERAKFERVILGNEHHIGPSFADTQWGTVNLAVVDWSQLC